MINLMHWEETLQSLCSAWTAGSRIKDGCPMNRPEDDQQAPDQTPRRTADDFFHPDLKTKASNSTLPNLYGEQSKDFVVTKGTEQGTPQGENSRHRASRIKVLFLFDGLPWEPATA